MGMKKQSECGFEIPETGRGVGVKVASALMRYLRPVSLISRLCESMDVTF